MVSTFGLLRSRWSQLLALLVLLAASGCGGVGKCHPVEGRILLGDQPLTGMSGMVLFVPDRDKGNASSFRAAGPIDAEGRYKLTTLGKVGAPPGWYKVLVNSVTAGTDDREVDTQLAVHSRYSGEKTTPLSVEVTAAKGQGAYDLLVSSD